MFGAEGVSMDSLFSGSRSYAIDGFPMFISKIFYTFIDK